MKQIKTQASKFQLCVHSPEKLVFAVFHLGLLPELQICYLSRGKHICGLLNCVTQGAPSALTQFAIIIWAAQLAFIMDYFPSNKFLCKSFIPSGILRQEDLLALQGLGIWEICYKWRLITDIFNYLGGREGEGGWALNMRHCIQLFCIHGFHLGTTIL